MQQCHHADYTHGIDPRGLPCPTGAPMPWRDLTPEQRRAMIRRRAQYLPAQLVDPYRRLAS